MRYQVILENISRKPLETLKAADAGEARVLFNESKDSVFCAHASLVAVSETGQRMTLERH